MKKTVILFLISCIIWCLTACGSEQKSGQENLIRLYFVSSDKTKVEMHEYDLQAREQTEQIEEVKKQLTLIPKKLEYIAPFSLGFSVLSYEMEEDILHLDLESSYKDMTATTEVLVRAAIVRSFTQIPGIDKVSITVAGQSLHDSLGNVVGIMSSDLFIDNAGSEINNYEKVRLKLYYANEAGDALVAVNRTVYYNTNVAVERLVLEEILAGPDPGSTEHFSTVNPGTKILNVTVKDGICYVNLDKAFLNQSYSVTADVTIYSIVNSLTELRGVNKVQILIDGETNLTYREVHSLNTVFERNLDLIEDEE